MSQHIVVGLDEAGVGPAWGSLWAAAVYLPAAIPGLADSKRLSARRREELRVQIVEAAHHGMGEVSAKEVDTFGLGEARRLVFERALDDFVANGGPFPSELIVDGTLFRPWRGVRHVCIPRADATVPCVSAASIMAKTTRDRQVVAMCERIPHLDRQYALRSNKGYLSPAHIAGLREHGYHALHRTSYRIRGHSEAIAEATKRRLQEETEH